MTVDICTFQPNPWNSNLCKLCFKSKKFHTTEDSPQKSFFEKKKENVQPSSNLHSKGLRSSVTFFENLSSTKTNDSFQKTSNSQSINSQSHYHHMKRIFKKNKPKNSSEHKTPEPKDNEKVCSHFKPHAFNTDTCRDCFRNSSSHNGDRSEYYDPVSAKTRKHNSVSVPQQKNYTTSSSLSSLVKKFESASACEKRNDDRPSFKMNYRQREDKNDTVRDLDLKNGNDDSEEIECMICYNDYPQFEMIQTCRDHDPFVCKECMKNEAQVKLNNNSPTILCLHCHIPLKYKHLRLILSPELLNKFNAMKSSSELGNMKYFRWCPYGDCKGGRYGTPANPKAQCYSCGRYFCFNHNMQWHKGKTCEEWNQMLQDSELSEEWISSCTRKCPNCGVPIEKNEGCNHMTCSHCTTDFWWCCLEKWTDKSRAHNPYCNG